jgi:HD-GYP domain-containing protein (c-di-GMP phosphodiesterase class II)
MEAKKSPIFELVIFSLVILIFYISGYFYFWQFLERKGSPDWQYLVFSTIFLIALIAMLLFFRRSLLSINKLTEEKLEIQQTYLKQLNNTYEGTLKALSYALDIRDHGTWGHSARVVGYALAIAEKNRLEGE